MGSRMLAGAFDTGLLLGLWLLAAVGVLFFEGRARSAVSHMFRNAMSREWILGGADAAGFAFLCAALSAVTIAYYVVAEIATRGLSPGKRALGLRVVRLDGRTIAWWQSVLRNLARVVDWLPGSYGVGLVAALVSARVQRLGDIVAGTMVVRERAWRSDEAAFTAGSAAGGLVSRLAPNELSLLAGFWARAPMMAPEARTRLASQIAPLLRARLADTSALDAEGFLWALLRDGAPR